MQYLASLRAFQMICQQAVAVVMEIANQRHIDIHAIEMLPDLGDRCGCFRRVDGNADQFGSGTRKFSALDRRFQYINRVGVGH